jgi:hypothetical protein
MSFAAPALAAVTNVADIGALAGVSNNAAVFPTFYVGADAAPSDVNAAINLAAYLAGNVFTSSAVTCAAGAAGADGVTLRQEIGWFTNATKDFDLGTSDLFLSTQARGGRVGTFLRDGSVTIGGTEYKFYEKLGGDKFDDSPAQTQNNGYQLVYGDSSASGTFENLYKDIGLTAPNGDLFYSLVFETPVPIGTANLTGKVLKFLGQDYTVTSSTASEWKLSPAAGGQFVAYQQSATIQGFSVKVTALGTANTDPVGLELSAGGETKAVSLAAGESATVTLGGQTTTISVSRVTPGSAGGAEVLVGSSAMKLTNGNTMAAPYADWQTYIFPSVSGGSTISNITLRYLQSRAGFTGSYPVLLPGKSLDFPAGLASLTFSGFEARDYVPLTFQPVLADLNGDASAGETGVKITTDTKVLNVGGGIFADTIAYDNDNNAWRYQNSTGGWQAAGAAPTITVTDGTVSFGANDCGGSSACAGTDLVINMTQPVATESGRTTSDVTWWLEYDEPSSGQGLFGNISLAGDVDNSTNANPTYLSFGGVMGANAATGALVKGFGGLTAPVSVAYAGSTPKSRSAFTDSYGTQIVSASTSIVQLKVPKTQMYANIILGKAAGAASTTGSSVSKTPVPLTGDYAKLDTEVADWSKISTDAVVMGGPAVNRAAASLLKLTYPTKGVASTVPENAALVQVFQNAFGSGKVAVLVAGWEAANTDLAVTAITAGKVTQAAPKVTVSGTVSAPVVTAA